MNDLRIFGAIEKTIEHDDGTLEVQGVASSEKRDEDPKAIAKWGRGEKITADAIRKAIPNYMRYGGTGPLREMHQLKAAGRTVGLHVDEQGRTLVRAVVVDSEAVKKVRNGVYVGFSVGGTATQRNCDDPSIIEGLNLTEISLVDRPANPDATISLWKADAMGDETEKAAAPKCEKCTDVEKCDEHKDAPPVAKVEEPGVEPEAGDVEKGFPPKAKAKEEPAADAPKAPPAESGAAKEQQQQAPAPPAKPQAQQAPPRDAAPSGPEAPPTPLFGKSTRTMLRAHYDALVKCADDFKKLGWYGEGEAAPSAEEQKQSPEPRSETEAPPTETRDTAAAADDDTEQTGAEEAADGESAGSDKAPPKGKGKGKPFGKADEPAPGADVIAKAARVDEVEKALTEANDAIAKAVAERDEISKTLGLAKDALTKVIGERDTLTKALAEANARLAAKGVLKVVPVEKSADTGTPVVEEEDTSKIADPVKRAEAEVRKVYRSGGVMRIG